MADRKHACGTVLWDANGDIKAQHRLHVYEDGGVEIRVEGRGEPIVLAFPSPPEPETTFLFPWERHEWAHDPGRYRSWYARWVDNPVWDPRADSLCPEVPRG